MKRSIKRIFVLTLLLVLSLSTICFTSAAEDAESVISEIGSNILGAVVWVGYAISLGMVVYIGIRYALGSADAKANMKGAVVSWLIGAFLVFGSMTVIRIVLKTANLRSDKGLADAIIDAATSTE